MAATDTIQLRGVKELTAALNKLEKNTRLKIMRRVSRQGSKEIQAEAVRTAPRLSGQTAKAIKVRAGKRRKGRLSYLVTIGSKNFVGNQFYGAFQEFGWFSGSRKLGRNRKYNQGTQFMRKAFLKKAPQLSRKLPSMMWDEIAKECAGLYKRKTRS
jgi:HK97 gp10 family phage protein